MSVVAHFPFFLEASVFFNSFFFCNSVNVRPIAWRQKAEWVGMGEEFCDMNF